MLPSYVLPVGSSHMTLVIDKFDNLRNYV